jgi:hypothetical protein
VSVGVGVAVLAQQRLIKMLEKQRNAEADKVKLLQVEVSELRKAHQQVTLPLSVSPLTDLGPLQIVSEMINQSPQRSQGAAGEGEGGGTKNHHLPESPPDSAPGSPVSARERDLAIPRAAAAMALHTNDEFEEKLEEDEDEEEQEEETLRVPLPSQALPQSNQFRFHGTTTGAQDSGSGRGSSGGVDLDEVSAIRATAQAQIERFCFSLFHFVSFSKSATDILKKDQKRIEIWFVIKFPALLIRPLLEDLRITNRYLSNSNEEELHRAPCQSLLLRSPPSHLLTTILLSTPHRDRGESPSIPMTELNQFCRERNGNSENLYRSLLPHFSPISPLTSPSLLCHDTTATTRIIKSINTKVNLF